MALPPEVRANYIAIIDSILQDSDLTLISAKKIRKGIQDQVEYDITPQKAAISALILERFDIFNAKESNDPAPVKSVEPTDNAPVVNGSHKASHALQPSPPVSDTPPKREPESEDISEITDRAPPKKKRKTSVDGDAALAAKLQAEEAMRARPTRGGNSRKTAPVKKKTPKKKKTSDRVRASDDSDIEGSGGESKPQKNTGFHKPLNLSPALSTLLGEVQLSRPQMTKLIWKYIKANDLQDPADKRYIICDDKMRDVFRQDKVHMFTMTKILNQNLYNPDE